MSARPSDEHASLACASCGQTIAGHYFTAGRAILCERCKFELQSSLGSGSELGRFTKAGVFGLGAAALSTVIWIAVTELTGYEIGLVAILVGFLVGSAVHVGSGRRGGRLYQAMAVVLTYFAIVATYVPYVIQSLDEAAQEDSSAAQEKESEAPVSQAADPPSPAAVDEGSVGSAEESDPAPTALDLAIALALILAIAAAAPFLAGFENAMGILIIGIALWEAWRRNRRVEVSIEGPFRLGEAAS